MRLLFGYIFLITIIVLFISLPFFLTSLVLKFSEQKSLKTVVLSGFSQFFLFSIIFFPFVHLNGGNFSDFIYTVFFLSLSILFSCFITIMFKLYEKDWFIKDFLRSNIILNSFLYNTTSY